MTPEQRKKLGAMGVLNKKKMIKHQIETNTKMNTSDQKEFEAFVKLNKLNKKELNTLGSSLDDAIKHYQYKTGKVQN